MSSKNSKKKEWLIEQREKLIKRLDNKETCKMPEDHIFVQTDEFDDSDMFLCGKSWEDSSRWSHLSLEKVKMTCLVCGKTKVFIKKYQGRG